MKHLKYRTLTTLLRNELVNEEDPSTVELIRKLKHVRKDKFLSRNELVDICLWKSARAVQHVRRNHPAKIRRLTSASFTSKSERTKLECLTQLYGVGIPMASSILTLIWPERYGVIDIRVWQLLFELGEVNSNPSGVGFNFENWYTMLCKLRYQARNLKTTVRTVERTLYLYHKEIQIGTLYKKQ